MKGSKKALALILGIIAVIVVIAVLAVVLLPGILENGKQAKLIEAADSAYSQYEAQDAAVASEQFFIYEAQGSYIAIQNGKASKIYATRDEAMTALLGENAPNYYCLATKTEGLCLLQEGSTEQLVADYGVVEELDASNMPDCSAKAMPFVYSNLCMFENRYITNIRLFVGDASDAEREYTFEISLLDGGSVKKDGIAVVKQTYCVNILGKDLVSNAWNTIDVSGLGICVGEMETLGFGSASSTLPIKTCNYQKSDDLLYYGYTMGVLAEQTGVNLLVGVQGVQTDTQFAAKKAQLKEQLQGKYLSILGDSICTFDGVSNDVTVNSTIGINKICYPIGNVRDAKDTFWMQLIHELEMNLLVNNSWSGSCVIPVDPAGAGYGIRATQLHADAGVNAGKQPDVIICNMGTNDILSNKPVGTVDEMTFAWAEQYVAGQIAATPSTFAEGYAVMVAKMAETYPDADIFLINMLVNSTVSLEKAEKYNKVVNAVAERYGCYVVDLTRSDMSGTSYDAYAVDGLHPNKSGMDVWTDLMIDALAFRYLEEE